MKILLTRAPNIADIEVQKDFVILKTPTFCLDDAEWRKTHEPTDLKLVAGKVA